MAGYLARMDLHTIKEFLHPTFTGRSEELATLAAWLGFERFPTVRAVTLAGMAGIGILLRTGRFSGLMPHLKSYFW